MIQAGGRWPWPALKGQPGEEATLQRALGAFLVLWRSPLTSRHAPARAP